ncbi:CpsD/CapB family tyrosine-protein kinase [Bacillus pumilus]|uniref:non-specific protein-tyrosine kinase n=1 Tax=Bacillus pumilus TaxID=1408 RepID=A0AAD0MPE1_BACPU|nr:CpsD/CapB family tyrosine-protein kinase [Bacillus pumilus]AVM25456.1 tyrosine protein kinase [Bacillus pumilus]TYS35223.1 CpsD/CapB family tyrosine-protein kinase [Bacillus pumilus]TYS43671.1 CpsD/CapB family tyrosine-protein kinase [Bacillus pumilus]TYS52635.1 CpsD/CapB family tyrosine-protein kinase [Bacillus pumilus]
MIFKRKKREKRDLSCISVLNPHSVIAEQFRTIRTNIEFTSIQTRLKSILVTSSLPKEGKSFTAANLAAVFAQQKKRVLLMDADLRKPAVHEYFDLSPHTGLTNVLLNNCSLEEAILPTPIEHLELLPSGTIPPNPAELLSSSVMKQLFYEIEQQYDMVIVDSTPLLPVADAKILANRTDGSILVVLSGKTKIAAVKKSKEVLEGTTGKLLGAMLNGKKEKKGRLYMY